ncbi:MAG: hypothetical protein ACQEQI_00240 [Bacillota bacterium]
MEDLPKILASFFALVACLLVGIITIVEGLSLLVIVMRSLLATILFALLGGGVGYLIVTQVSVSKNNSTAKEEINSVSKQTAAQQYSTTEEMDHPAEQNESNENKDEAAQEFEPLDLEEVDYDEQQELEELAEQDPEKLANMVETMQKE